jgi:hypothetical protein
MDQSAFAKIWGKDGMVRRVFCLNIQNQNQKNRVNVDLKQNGME